MRTLERAREGGDPYQARVASEDRARVALHAVWTDIDHVLDAARRQLALKAVPA